MAQAIRVERGRVKQRALLGIGSALLIAGSLLVISGVFDRFTGSDRLVYEKRSQIPAGAPGFPPLTSRYPPEAITRYAIRHEDSGAFELHVADYRDERNALRRAMLYLADAEQQTPDDRSALARLRQDLWRAAMDAILEHTDERALFLAWWDDAQRVHFFTGRETWAKAPVADAYEEADQRALWREMAGGFAEDQRPLRLLARWLTMDADRALTEMAARLPRDRPVYVLVSLDGLARLSELESLYGMQLPFETRTFPSGTDIHASIARVKRWASEKGGGSYLVQQLPGMGVRAWRITTREGEKTLLARLLPFTGSLADPLKPMTLVYQSTWGGYLSIYRWEPRSLAAVSGSGPH
jgi:hydroxylamine oxidation protein HaoB